MREPENAAFDNFLSNRCLSLPNQPFLNVTACLYSCRAYPISHTMVTGSCNELLAPIIFLLARTYTSSAQLANNNPSTHLTALRPGVNYFQATMSTTCLADDTRDCLQAALLLPEGTDAGVFHSGNLNNALI